MSVRDPWINKDIATSIIAKLNRIEVLNGLIGREYEKQEHALADITNYIAKINEENNDANSTNRPAAGP